jgi:hypothetical protein
MGLLTEILFNGPGHSVKVCWKTICLSLTITGQKNGCSSRIRPDPGKWLARRGERIGLVYNIHCPPGNEITFTKQTGLISRKLA